MFEGIFNSGKLSWNNSNQIFNVLDKGKIPPNTPVAWVIPADGLSLHEQASTTSIAATVLQISTLGQIAVIQLRLNDGLHTITWQASAAEVKRLSLKVNSAAHIEIDSTKIHIMPLRPINDPRRFSS
jgi:molybdate transport system ATP-binding protein